MLHELDSVFDEACLRTAASITIQSKDPDILEREKSNFCKDKKTRRLVVLLAHTFSSVSRKEKYTMAMAAEASQPGVCADMIPHGTPSSGIKGPPD